MERYRRSITACVLAVLLTVQAGYCENAVKKCASTGSSTPVMGQFAQSFHKPSAASPSPDKVTAVNEVKLKEVPKPEYQGQTEQSYIASIEVSDLEQLQILSELLARTREVLEKLKQWMKAKK